MSEKGDLSDVQSFKIGLKFNCQDESRCGSRSRVRCRFRTSARGLSPRGNESKYTEARLAAMLVYLDSRDLIDIAERSSLVPLRLQDE